MLGRKQVVAVGALGDPVINEPVDDDLPAALVRPVVDRLEDGAAPLAVPLYPVFVGALVRALVSQQSLRPDVLYVLPARLEKTLAPLKFGERLRPLKAGDSLLVLPHELFKQLLTAAAPSAVWMAPCSPRSTVPLKSVLLSSRKATNVRGNRRSLLTCWNTSLAKLSSI